MTKKNIIILFCIILVALLALCWFTWNPRSWTSEQIPPPSDTSEIPSEDLSAVNLLKNSQESPVPADWETYQTGSPLQLSLKHPEDLIFQKIDNSSEYSSGGLSIYQDTSETRAFIAGGDIEQPLGMHLTVSDNYGSVEEYIRAKNSLNSNAPKLEAYATVPMLGTTAYVLSSQGMDYWDGIIFPYKGRVYEATIAYGSPSDQARSTFYQILVSIK